MKKIIMFASLIFIISCCNSETKENAKDLREKIKGQWQENIVCIRVGNQCGCCNGAQSYGCGFNFSFAAFSISSCEFAEKMGLKIY